MKKLNNVLLWLGVICLITVPLVANTHNSFTGTDDQAEAQILELNPGYTPWVEPILSVSGKTETLLFAAQAGIGGLVALYCFYRLKGRQGLNSHEN